MMFFHVSIYYNYRREVFNEELEESTPEPTDFRSVTMKDFNIEGFKSERPAPTQVRFNVNITINGG